MGIQAWSGGYPFLGLVIIAAICVFMGCGGPSLTAYFIVSMFAAPALMKMGVTFEQAHFFTMFFAVFAFLTPPVALVALIASKLAEASYISSSIEATKAAIGGFIIPFIFIYCPALLLQPKGPLSAIQGLLASIVCLFVLEVAFVGYFKTQCSVWERVLAALAGLALLLYFVLDNQPIFFGGLALCVIITAAQWRKKRTYSTETAPESGSL